MNPPRNKLSALEAASRSLAAGEPVPEPVASWLAAGFRWYVDHAGGSLDESLLLKSAPGKLSVWRQARYQQRNENLRNLAESVDGICWRSAEAIVNWLREMDASDGLVPENLPEIQLYYLVAAYLADSPRTTRRIWEIIRPAY